VSYVLLSETITIGFVGFCGTGLLLYLSYNYISVGLATMLNFIYPTLVTVIMVIFYKEKCNLNKILSVILSLIGLFFLIGFEKITISLPGVLLALGSGLAFAYYIVGMNVCKLRELPPILMTFYVSLFSGIAMLIITLFHHDYIIHFNLNNIFSMLFISIFSTVLSLITFMEGIKIIGATNGAILNTIEPIVSVVLGVIILSEPLSLFAVIGCILIVISLLIINMQTDKLMK
jgi:drug/metabolite transporter (DMT)-like permease